MASNQLKAFTKKNIFVSRGRRISDWELYGDLAYEYVLY